LLPSEQTVIESMKSSENKYFVPVVWATAVVEKARKEGKIKGEIAVQQVLDASIKLCTLCFKGFGVFFYLTPWKIIIQ